MSSPATGARDLPRESPGQEGADTGPGKDEQGTAELLEGQPRVLGLSEDSEAQISVFVEKLFFLENEM